MNRPKYLTIVVEMVDREAAASVLTPFFESFVNDAEFSGMRVTGMSNEDEMSRVEELEAELEERRV